MKNFKSTKRALLTSVLSLALCFTMLLGTTFAWFTDSVTSKNNIITAGNLDIELYYQVEGQTDWTKVTDKTNIFKENALWEPGHTEVVKLKVVNEGSLALKYQLGVNVAGETESVNVAGEAFKLSDYIMYGIVDGDATYENRAEAIALVDEPVALKNAYGSGTIELASKAEKIVTMVVYMPTSVGNEANAKLGAATPTINLGINLFATQASAEKDSFGKDYDNDAWVEGFKVTTGTELVAAIENGETEIVLEDDITIDAPIVIPAPTASTMSLRSTSLVTVLDLNGKTINVAYAEGSTTNHVYAFENYGNLVITGNGTINARGIFNYGNMVLESGTINAIDGNGGYAVRNYEGATFTMNGGTIATTLEDDHLVDKGGYDASTVRVDAGATFVMNGGVINNICDWTPAIYNEGTTTINAGTVTSVHSTLGNEGGTMTINGGSFTCNGVEGKTQHVLYASSGSTTTINGGTFDGKDTYNGFNVDAGKGAVVDIYGGNFLSVHSGSLYGEGTINVYGGKFFDKPADNRIVPGYKAEEIDGVWVVGVAIKDAADLQAAIDNAKNGDTILLVQDITSADGVLIADKNLTIDLGGHKFTVSEGASTSNRNIKIIGSSVVTVKNGTLVAEGNNNGGAYGTIRTEGTANVTLENLNLYNYRGGGLNVKAVSGTTVTINNCEIYSQYGGGVEASGGTIVLNDTKIEQKGVYSNGWYSVAMEINSSGKITVNSGEYSGSAIETDANATMGNCVAFILSSGGTLEINGGTFTGVVSENAAAGNFCGLIYADRAAVVNINGGTFNSNGPILDMRNNAGSQPNPKATISGGTFSADPRVSGLYASNLISIKEGYVAKENADGTWSIAFDGVVVSTADELTSALTSGKNISLANNIEYTQGILLADGITLNGNGYSIIYSGTEYSYQLVKMSTDSKLQNVTLENYRVRTENTTNGTVTLTNVVVLMDGDQTGIDISRGAGVAKLTNVVCKNITDEAHLNPSTQVQVDYTPYGDVLLGGAWALEATDCDFGSLHGWNTRNGSSVSLNNTTTTVFRMHYWSNRTLYIDGVETAWSESGAIPVAHDVGGCWSVQPSFK